MTALAEATLKISTLAKVRCRSSFGPSLLLKLTNARTKMEALRAHDNTMHPRRSVAESSDMTSMVLQACDVA